MQLVGRHEVLESVFVEMDPLLARVLRRLRRACGSGGELRAPGDRRRHGQPPP